METGYTSSRAQNFFLHPHWNPSSPNYRGDIAVATLIQGIEFSDFIKPICVWQKTHDHADIINKIGIIAGKKNSRNKRN